jgi:hypothetical protein
MHDDALAATKPLRQSERFCAERKALEKLPSAGETVNEAVMALHRRFHRNRSARAPGSHPGAFMEQRGRKPARTEANRAAVETAQRRRDRRLRSPMVARTTKW